MKENSDRVLVGDMAPVDPIPTNARGGVSWMTERLDGIRAQGELTCFTFGRILGKAVGIAAMPSKIHGKFVLSSAAVQNVLAWGMILPKAFRFIRPGTLYATFYSMMTEKKGGGNGKVIFSFKSMQELRRLQSLAAAAAAAALFAGGKRVRAEEGEKEEEKEEEEEEFEGEAEARAQSAGDAKRRKE